MPDSKAAGILNLSKIMIRIIENIEVISVMFYQYFTTDITGKPLGDK